MGYLHTCTLQHWFQKRNQIIRKKKLKKTRSVNFRVF